MTILPAKESLGASANPVSHGRLVRTAVEPKLIAVLLGSIAALGFLMSFNLPLLRSAAGPYPSRRTRPGQEFPPARRHRANPGIARSGIAASRGSLGHVRPGSERPTR